MSDAPRPKLLVPRLTRADRESLPGSGSRLALALEGRALLMSRLLVRTTLVRSPLAASDVRSLRDLGERAVSRATLLAGRAATAGSAETLVTEWRRLAEESVELAERAEAARQAIPQEARWLSVEAWHLRRRVAWTLRGRPQGVAHPDAVATLVLASQWLRERLAAVAPRPGRATRALEALDRVIPGLRAAEQQTRATRASMSLEQLLRRLGTQAVLLERASPLAATPRQVERRRLWLTLDTLWQLAALQASFDALDIRATVVRLDRAHAQARGVLAPATLSTASETLRLLGG